MMSAPGVRAVACPSCGGAIPLARLEPQATCPYCAYRWQLAAAELAELSRYREHVQGQLARANQAYGEAAVWDYYYGSEDAQKKQKPWIVMVLFGVLVVALGGAAMVLPQLGLAPNVLNVAMPVATFTLFFGIIGGYLFWFYRGRKRIRRTANLDAAGVRCPSCGAPQRLASGQVLERCRFCAAAFLPDRVAMKEVAAQADHALLRAQIERGRSLRRGMATISRISASNATPYIVFGSFLPITVIGSAAFTVDFFVSDKRDTPLAGLFLLWGIALFNSSLLGVVYLFRKVRRERWQARIGAVSEPLSASFLAGIDGVNAWLDRHWAGEVPMTQLFPGPCLLAVAGHAEGYPFQLVANPVGSDENYPGYVIARVAAWLPDLDRVRASASYFAARQTLDAQGFELGVERAGLSASAKQKSARRWGTRGDPVQLAHAVQLLARAAREVGAEPVVVA
jgi:hypothetical protein